jgi:hypothetical protein
MKQKNKAIVYYLILISFHFAHVLEETWRRFWLIDALGNIGVFLFINWILFFIPLILLYYVILGKRVAYKLSIAYAIFMVLNGIGHNIATVVTGKYFYGYAGGVSVIGPIIFGVLLLLSLFKNIPKMKTDM